MPRGDKSSYTGKQKRMAEHIEEGYERRGVSKDEAKRRAWATVNKESHGGKKSGSGRGKAESHASSRKGGKKGGHSMSHAEPGRQEGLGDPQASRVVSRRGGDFWPQPALEEFTRGRGQNPGCRPCRSH